MQAIVQVLNRLFGIASKVGGRTGRGLISHATGKVGVNAIRRLNLVVGETRISYQHLSDAEKKGVDELVEYAARLLWAYIDHHDESTSSRLQGASLDEILKAHAQELVNAGKRAFESRVRSHAYDFVVGRPQRTSIIQNEDTIKQLILATVQELHDYADELVRKKQCGYCGFVGVFNVPGNCPSCGHRLTEIAERSQP